MKVSAFGSAKVCVFMPELLLKEFMSTMTMGMT